MIQPEKRPHIPSSSVVPVKGFAREVLRTAKETDPFIKAVLEYTDAEFYIAKEIGEPEYHTGRAAKSVAKLNLSPEEISRAMKVAHELLISYGQSPANQDTSLTPETIEMLEAKRREEEERKEKARILRKVALFEGRFTKLMALSDEQLRIVNSNPRVDFSSDLVFKRMNKDGKEQFKQRAVSGEIYEDTITNMLMEQNTILIKTHMLDPQLISRKVEGLQNNNPLRQRLGEEKFSRFIEYIHLLTSGEPVAKADIIQAGLSVDLVVRQARTILSSLVFDVSEREHLLHLMSKGTTEHTPPWEQDPNWYLGDSSGRRNLGYVQGTQELKD